MESYGVFSQKKKQDTENVVYLSIFSRRITSDDFKNVLNYYLHQNCPNFPGSMTTSGLPNGYLYRHFKDGFKTFLFDKSFL